MKRRYSVIMVILQLFTGLFGAFSVAHAELQSGFTDTGAYAWKNSILYLKDAGVVQGYGDGTFRPDQKINRAEFTKIIIAGRFSDELNGNFNRNCFSDISSDEWYTQYICLAKEKGIVGGYPDGEFKPGQNIRQAEALKILLLSFDYSVPETGGEWYQKYLDTAQSIGMLYFASNNSAGYEITRGEMAYFTAWLMNKQDGQTLDQVTPFAGAGPFTYTVDGSTHVVKMNAADVKMNVMSGNNSLRPKNSGKCSLSSDCMAESQAESFNGFVERSHKELLVNGAFFDAYSLPLDGFNYHQISSDIVMNGQMMSIFGYKEAFGNGGMLAQWHDNTYRVYFPARDWLSNSPFINFAISNYPMILAQGHIRTRDEIGIYAENDSKFWVSSRRGGLGISGDGSTLYYVSAVGTVGDLANKMLEQGAEDAFALDAGGSNAFSLNGRTVFSPGRNLTTVVEFYRYQ